MGRSLERREAHHGKLQPGKPRAWPRIRHPLEAVCSHKIDDECHSGLYRIGRQRVNSDAPDFNFSSQRLGRRCKYGVSSPLELDLIVGDERCSVRQKRRSGSASQAAKREI